MSQALITVATYSLDKTANNSPSTPILKAFPKANKNTYLRRINWIKTVQTARLQNQLNVKQ